MPSPSQSNEASTWILLLQVWTCLSLPHRLTSPCLPELAVNTTRLLSLNLQTKNTTSNKHKRRSIKITASKIIISKGTRNRTTTTTTRPLKRVALPPPLEKLHLLESLAPLVTLHLLGMMMTAALQATINLRTTDDMIAVINNMQRSGEAAMKSL